LLSRIISIGRLLGVEKPAPSVEASHDFPSVRFIGKTTWGIVLPLRVQLVGIGPKKKKGIPFWIEERVVISKEK